MISKRLESFKSKYGERHELDLSTANRTPADLMIEVDEEAIEKAVADIVPVLEVDTKVVKKKPAPV